MDMRVTDLLLRMIIGYLRTKEEKDMTQSQKKIIERFDELNSPLKKHVADLEELCKDPVRTVARDFLNYYKAELNQWEEFRLMLLAEFIEQGNDEA